MEFFQRWLDSDLDSTARIWSALAPAILLTAYLLVAMLVFAVLHLVRGHPEADREMRERGAGPLLGLWIRYYFIWALRPIWRLVVWTGIPASSVTMLSVLLSAGAGVSLAFGKFALGGWLYIFAGVCDIFDGRLARLRDEASPRGAALDSFVDRYAEAFVFGGLAWYYRDSWVLLAVLGAMVGSFMVSYARASGERLGVDARLGTMQRPERITYLGASTALSPILEVWFDPTDPYPINRLAVLAIVFVLVGANATAIRRLVFVMGHVKGPENGVPLASEMRRNKAARGIGEWRMFSRSVASSVAATLLDFLSVTLMVTMLSLWPTVATFLGCLVGGATNFAINRVWAFPHGGGTLANQSTRYTVVSLSSALLNAGGVALLTLVPDVDYRISWWLVRLAVYVAWNYPLNRNYVFPLVARVPR